MTEFNFGTGPGQQTFQDDDGQWVRIGAVPEEVKAELKRIGKPLLEMPELRDDGIIYYPDGSTKVFVDTPSDEKG